MRGQLACVEKWSTGSQERKVPFCTVCVPSAFVPSFSPPHLPRALSASEISHKEIMKAHSSSSSPFLIVHFPLFFSLLSSSMLVVVSLSGLFGQPLFVSPEQSEHKSRRRQGGRLWSKKKKKKKSVVFAIYLGMGGSSGRRKGSCVHFWPPFLA